MSLLLLFPVPSGDIPATAYPAGVSSAASVGSATAAGAAQGSPAGAATTGAIGSGTGTGTATTAPAGFTLVAYLGTATASAGDAPPEPPAPPPTEIDRRGDSEREWEWYFQNLHRMRTPGQAFPLGVSCRARLGTALASGGSSVGVSGFDFRLRFTPAHRLVRAGATARPRPPAALRFAPSVARVSVAANAIPKPPLRYNPRANEEAMLLAALLLK